MVKELGEPDPEAKVATLERSMKAITPVSWFALP